MVQQTAGIRAGSAVAGGRSVMRSVTLLLGLLSAVLCAPAGRRGPSNLSVEDLLRVLPVPVPVPPGPFPPMPVPLVPFPPAQPVLYPQIYDPFSFFNPYTPFNPYIPFNPYDSYLPLPIYPPFQPQVPVQPPVIIAEPSAPRPGPAQPA